MSQKKCWVELEEGKKFSSDYFACVSETTFKKSLRGEAPGEPDGEILIPVETLTSTEHSK